MHEAAAGCTAWADSAGLHWADSNLCADSTGLHWWLYGNDDGAYYDGDGDCDSDDDAAMMVTMMMVTLFHGPNGPILYMVTAQFCTCAVAAQTALCILAAMQTLRSP